MGAQERQPDADLNAAVGSEAEARGRLAAYGLRAGEFDFYRLLYLLERCYPAAPRLGKTGPARDERIRLRSDAALVFASSDVTELGTHKFPDGVERTRVTAAFMGLYGSTSPLPAHFVESIALSVHQGGPQPVRELLDVIHHRVLSLVYRSWAKYRHSVGYTGGGRDAFTRRMLCSVGVDGFGESRGELNPFYLMRFAPLLASKSRAARGLAVVLEELLGGIGTEIEQFVGHWTLIEKPLRNKLGVANHELGDSLVIGRYVFDGSGRYTIRLGPLQYDDYLSFLPGGHRRPFVQSVVNTFTPGIHDTMLELHVDLDAAPRFQLGSPRASTLQRTCWLGSSGEQTFCITVPLDDGAAAEQDLDDDDDRGEPPPLP